MELKVPNSQVTKEAQNGSLFEATGLSQCSREPPGDTQCSWGKGSLPGSGQAGGLAEE